MNRLSLDFVLFVKLGDTRGRDSSFGKPSVEIDSPLVERLGTITLQGLLAEEILCVFLVELGFAASRLGLLLYLFGHGISADS